MKHGASGHVYPDGHSPDDLMPHRQQNQRALALALLCSLVLWNLPHAGLVFYPFKLLATWMHELSHGLVMMITGAGFDRVEIYRDTSGLAFADYGVGAAGRAAIAAAGYMGTPILGAAILLGGQTRGAARAVLLALAALLGLSAVLWVANDFGVTAVASGAVVFALLAALAPERVARFLVQFVAAQACVNALLDVRALFRPNLVVNGEVMRASDAHNMAAATAGTPEMWAGIWLVWSFAVLVVVLRVVHVRASGAARATATRGPRPADATTGALPGGSDCDARRRSRG